jgi:two-component system chemotaxis response regulator CheB
LIGQDDYGLAIRPFNAVIALGDALIARFGDLGLKTKRVLIIDDDHAVLEPVGEILKLEGYVVDKAETGKEAIEKSNVNDYNLAIIDYRLPDMEGTRLLTAMREMTPRMIKIILTGFPSAANRAEAERGHADAFILKPIRIVDLLKIVREFLAKQELPTEKVEPEVIKRSRNELTVVAIGASAGGPKALGRVFANLPGNLQAPVVVSQHMPKGFSKILARQLAVVAKLDLKEAESGDVLRVGQALLTPGGFNMEIRKGGVVRIGKAEQIPAPSIDMMMNSVAELYGSKTVGVLLTGMLTDGVQGMKAIKNQGGVTIVQDEESSVVFGMPKAALEAGAADIVANIDDVSSQIVTALEKINRRKTRSTLINCPECQL